MDENQFGNQENNFEGSSDVFEAQTDEFDDFGKTQEMDSVQLPKLSGEDGRGIMSREEFTELNSADDMSKTLLMDSMGGDIPRDEYSPAENPVKRRKKKHKKKQTNHTRTMGQIFLGVVISVAAIGIGSVLAVKAIGAMRDVTGMAKPHKELEFEINDNMGVNEIVDELYKGGIIDMPSLLKTYINVTHSENGFLNGTFTVSSNMSYSNLIETLKTKKVYTEVVDVAIPEGLTAAEIGKLLEEKYVCRASDFEAYVKSKQNEFDFEESIADNPNRLYALDGYLFPDTYNFYVIDDLKKNPNFDTAEYAKRAADTMFQTFEDKVTKSMKARMNELGMTMDETVILASLIQWEGTNEDNMAMVSSVFHNRLNDPENYPKLESDTTYTYIDRVIKPKTTSSNKAKMQKITEAYDTYNCVGLPAGAICNPGLEAINAALYPASTDYYYFLASNDGEFYYAQTLEQHEWNIDIAGLRDPDENSDGEEANE